MDDPKPSGGEVQENELVMPPREAANQLGVAVSTLRRLAVVYQDVHGALPWDGPEGRGSSRLWTQTAVARVKAARAVVASGRAKSLDVALRALAGGTSTPAEPDAPTGDELVRLRSEVRALFERLAEDRRLTERLERENEELRQRLALPDPRIADLEQARADLNANNDDLRQTVADLRTQIAAAPLDRRKERELEQTNRYLLGELERRRLEAEAVEKARPWWRLWGRG